MIFYSKVFKNENICMYNFSHISLLKISPPYLFNNKLRIMPVTLTKLFKYPYLKWLHCWHCTWKGWMPKLGVCIKILCPKPIAFSTHLIQSHPTVPGLCVLFLWQSGELSVKPWLRFCNGSRRHQPTCPKDLLLCSCSPSLCSIHPLICSRSSVICLEISKHYCPA